MATSVREKRRVAEELNCAGLTRKDFALSKGTSDEIRRRDRAEKQAREMKIRVR